jgi:hypothetical protein
VLQQGPHHPHQVVRRRHQRDRLPLWVVAPHPLEVRPHRRRPPKRLPGRIGEPLADDRRTLAGDVSQPIPVVRLILAGDQAEVPADRLGIPEAMRVVDEGGHGLRGAGAHPGDAP